MNMETNMMEERREVQCRDADFGGKLSLSVRSHGNIDISNCGVLSGLRGLGTREGYWRLLQGHSVCVFELGSIGRVGEWMEADHDVFMIVRVLHRTLFLEFCTAGEFYSY
jgi:hypothetical protein